MSVKTIGLFYDCICSSRSLLVGQLSLKMIQSLQLDSVLPQLLTALLERLSTASSPPLIQTIVLVFARLMHLNMNSVMGFLGI
jgi:hypothetical protein